MKYVLQIFFVLNFSAAALMAEVPQKKILGMPDNYEHPYGPHERDLNHSGPCKSVQYKQEQWIVYSDRADNQTYKNKELTQPFEKLNFMDRFFVVEDLCDKGIIHIIKYERSILKGGKAKLDIDNKAARDMGYIKKEKMLLWRYSLEADTTNFTIKALPGHSIESYTDKKKSSATYDPKKAELPLFNDPALTNVNEETVRLFDFLYIYKTDKENNSYLIGRSDVFTISSTTDILGWAPKSYIIQWNQRICLEPNSKIDAVNERREKGIKACLLEKQQEANTFALNPVGVQPLLERDPGRMDTIRT